MNALGILLHKDFKGRRHLKQRGICSHNYNKLNKTKTLSEKI